MHAGIHPCMHTCDAFMHASIHACIHTCMHSCMRTYMHAHACIHACIHTCANTYMHAYIHAVIYACIHICVHTYMQAFMHSCIHAHMRVLGGRNSSLAQYIHTHSPMIEAEREKRSRRAPRKSKSIESKVDDNVGPTVVDTGTEYSVASEQTDSQQERTCRIRQSANEKCTRILTYTTTRSSRDVYDNFKKKSQRGT